MSKNIFYNFFQELILKLYCIRINLKWGVVFYKYPKLFFNGILKIIAKLFFKNVRGRRNSVPEWEYIQTLDVCLHDGTARESSEIIRGAVVSCAELWRMVFGFLIVCATVLGVLIVLCLVLVIRHNYRPRRLAVQRVWKRPPGGRLLWMMSERCRRRWSLGPASGQLAVGRQRIWHGERRFLWAVLLFLLFSLLVKFFERLEEWLFFLIVERGGPFFGRERRIIFWERRTFQRQRAARWQEIVRRTADRGWGFGAMEIRQQRWWRAGCGPKQIFFERGRRQRSGRRDQHGRRWQHGRRYGHHAAARQQRWYRDRTTRGRVVHHPVTDVGACHVLHCSLYSLIVHVRVRALYAPVGVAHLRPTLVRPGRRESIWTVFAQDDGRVSAGQASRFPGRTAVEHTQMRFRIRVSRLHVETETGSGFVLNVVSFACNTTQWICKQSNDNNAIIII